MNKKTFYLAYTTNITQPDFQSRMATLRWKMRGIRGLEFNEFFNVSLVPQELQVQQACAVDLFVAVLDHHSYSLAELMERRTKSGKPIWCFFPRETMVDVRFSKFFHPNVTDFANQRMFAYDDDENVLSMLKTMFPVPIPAKRQESGSIPIILG